MSHANAALNPRHRLRLARLIVDEGRPASRAAKFFHVSWRTADRWAQRYRVEGPVGMNDRVLEPAHPARQDTAAGGAQDRPPAVEAATGTGSDRWPAGRPGLDRACGPGAVSAQPALPHRSGHR